MTIVGVSVDAVDIDVDVVWIVIVALFVADGGKQLLAVTWSSAARNREQLRLILCSFLIRFLESGLNVNHIHK